MFSLPDRVGVALLLVAIAIWRWQNGHAICYGVGIAIANA